MSPESAPSSLARASALASASRRVGACRSGSASAANWPSTKHQFDPNTITLEIRPILEKDIGKWYFSLNPDLTKSVRGPDRHSGLGFEPGLKISYNLTKRLAPGLEYYAETGPIDHFRPLDQQHHLIFSTLYVNASPDWELDFAVGRGLTGSSEHWIVKWIIGRRFKF
ncbi:MAG TPA: hypothetical protein VKE24_13275 [Candidatus Acidoferrales bacterium]|nr:hypothetical protein [Candidatus Acidoferrales bacterium]